MGKSAGILRCAGLKLRDVRHSVHGAKSVGRYRGRNHDYVPPAVVYATCVQHNVPRGRIDIAESEVRIINGPIVDKPCGRLSIWCISCLPAVREIREEVRGPLHLFNKRKAVSKP